MSFAEEFKEVERQALVENTAQDVFNILKDLESQASLHASRWIWELLQNARDATPLTSKLRVCICLNSTEVTFQHNGLGFTKDQVAHLIRHGSTKSPEEKLLGRFGTGFLSSHIISKVPWVSGQLNDGRRFAFVLDRTGTNTRELTASMERSSQQFVRSVTLELEEIVDYTTRFVYPLTPAVESIAQQGVQSVEAYASYVLAFNDEIECIEIVRNENRRIYKRQPKISLNGIIQLTPIEISAPGADLHLSYSVASLASEKVAVAVAAKQIEGNYEIQFGPEVPRLFMAFPLFGSESVGFPGVVNSRWFCPKKDRDGLYLGQEQAEYNINNKTLIQEACPLFLVLLEECAKSQWKGIDLLCRIADVGPIRGVDDKWLKLLIKQSLVERIRETALVPTCGGKLIKPSNACIPLDTSVTPIDEFWQLLHCLSNSDETLVERATALLWEKNVRGWAAVLETPIELMRECMTLKKCASTLASLGSLETLRQALRSDCNPVEWCNRLFGFLIEANQATLFDSLALLPDQNGKFRNRKDLFLDHGIDDGLKDIGELLELPIRARLLHKGVAPTGVSKLLQRRTQVEVLTEICSHLRSQGQKDKQVSGFREGNTRLFAWLLKNDALEYFDSFPALTQETHRDGESASTITLGRNDEVDVIPLAPPNCWPEPARGFSDLFPARHVLSSDYQLACPDESLWVSLSNRGYVRLSPISETTEYMQDFIPDSTLTDDVSHKSKVLVTTTQIAFLRMKNVGLMDAARKSKTKCLLLLRFLAAYLIRTDRSWTESVSVECECGQSHKYCKAGWIVPLKRNRWVYLDKNRSDLITVESLAGLLRDESEIVRLLSDDEGPAFLAAIGVSAVDFLMLVVTSDEASRVALSKSFIQIFQATGGNIQQVTDLASEIVAHPDTIKEIRDRVLTRRRVLKNQDVGKAVEKAIAAALGSGLGLKVEREPIGSDYSVEPENDFLDESDSEILLKVSTPHVRFLIEIKATVREFVRMTDVQGKKAKANPNCYALCVVVLSGQEEAIDETTVSERSKFVFDIGTRIKPLVESLESVEGSRKVALTTSGPIELEMLDQVVKFKVGHEVWEAGVGFYDAVAVFGGASTSTEASSVDTDKSGGKKKEQESTLWGCEGA